MSEDAFQAFQASLQNDPSLQQALAAAAEAYAQAVVSIAAEAGFSISAEEVQAAQRSQLPDALSDDDLDGVVGGGYWQVGGAAGWTLGSTQPGGAWFPSNSGPG